MDDKNNSFDYLVAGLTSNDRVELLQQLKIQLPTHEQVHAIEEILSVDGSIDLKEALKRESFFMRIRIFLQSLFSNTDKELVYNNYRISSLARKVDAKYPDLIDPDTLSLANGFYEDILELRRVTVFFRPGIAEYEEDEGNFLVLLGSLIMPDLTVRLEKKISPYSMPFSSEITPDLRPSLLRQMEVILSEISQADKAKLYACVQWLGWLKELVHLPFDRLLLKFTANTEGKLYSPMNSVLSEITQFASILCNAKEIQPEALQALYMFQSQTRINTGEIVDVQGEASVYLDTSMDYLSLVKRFIGNVSMRTIGAIAHSSCFWAPTYIEGGQDWFVRYKAQWRKIFDTQWESWLQERKLVQTKAHVTALFGIRDYPRIPNRPWETLGGNLQCSKEYSLGFLYAFFTHLYPQYSDTLRILMVDGKFILRENRAEFTDTYNEMNHLVDTVMELNMKLAKKGLYGEAFNQVGGEVLRTIQGQSKIQSYMRSIEAEASFIIVAFGTICRSLLAIFDGILVEKRNPKYDSLVNLASLMGSGNTPIRKSLVEISQSITTAFDLLKEVEMIELNSPIK